MADQSSLDVLAQLAETIEARKGAEPGTSYTAKLLASGTEKCAKKFGEEAVEIVLAVMTGDRKHIISEAADVLYHLLVLLAEREISLDEVMAELHRRTAMSGIDEKAARKSGALSQG